jgi:hypothetical protein
MYRIREVNGHDDDVADTLAELHHLTFFQSAPLPEFDWGHWWLAYYGRLPVAFAGLVPSTDVENAGYFSRVGAVEEHCGRALQLRLMRRCNCAHAIMDGASSCPTPPTISPLPTTSSKPVIGSITLNTCGVGLIPFIGGSPCGVGKRDLLIKADGR